MSEKIIAVSAGREITETEFNASFQNSSRLM
jgi:hypothetical protein